MYFSTTIPPSVLKLAADEVGNEQPSEAIRKATVLLARGFICDRNNLKGDLLTIHRLVQKVILDAMEIGLGF